MRQIPYSKNKLYAQVRATVIAMERDLGIDNPVPNERDSTRELVTRLEGISDRIEADSFAANTLYGSTDMGPIERKMIVDMAQKSPDPEVFYSLASLGSRLNLDETRLESLDKEKPLFDLIEELPDLLSEWTRLLPNQSRLS